MEPIKCARHTEQPAHKARNVTQRSTHALTWHRTRLDAKLDERMRCHVHERRLAGIAQQLRRSTQTSAPAAEEDDDLRAIPWAEIMAHNSADSAWVVIRDRVYDVTEFIQVRDPNRG